MAVHTCRGVVVNPRKCAVTSTTVSYVMQGHFPFVAVNRKL